MYRMLVSINLSAHGLETIKARPELPKQEMAFVSQWKADGILESFFTSVSKTGAVLIFKEVDEAQAKALIESLPYFPFMEKIEYQQLNKQF